MSQNTPEIQEHTEQHCVVIPIRATMSEWGKVNALVQQVYGWLAQNNIPPAEAVFYRYHTIGDMEKEFSLEVGVPVAHPVPCSDPVKPGTIPAGRYASVVHHGHPDGIMQTASQLEEWAKEQGIEWDTTTENGETIWGGRFQFFLTNPAEQPDMSQWETELRRRIKG